MPKRVDFVDDSPTVRALVTRWLTTASYEVRTFPNGEEAYRAVLADPPDLLISDVNMPRMDGFLLCHQLKQHNAEFPILLLTRLNEPRDILRGLEAGADGFLIKMVPETELLGRVQLLLSESESGRLPARVARAIGEKLKLTQGRMDLFRLLFDSICREIPIDLLALLADDGESDPSLVLVGRQSLSPQLVEWASREVLESHAMLKPHGPAPQSVRLQALATEQGTGTSSWTPEDVKSRAKVPLVVDGALFGMLGVFGFSQQALFDENIRFFFDLGVDSARALRRVSVA